MERLSVEQLKPGDVLLCSSGGIRDKLGRIIQWVTKSKYVHAAICICDGIAAESMTKGGIRKTPLRDLVGRYDYVAVLRQPDAWCKSRVAELQSFVERLIEEQSGYNWLGALMVVPNSESYRDGIMNRVKEYCTNPSAIPDDQRNSYFCSELVVSCYFATGFLHKNLMAIYHPASVTPAGLGKDYAFGTLLGYLSKHEDFQVPTEDDLYNEPTYGAIFGPI